MHERLRRHQLPAVVPVMTASTDAVGGLCLGLATLVVLGAVEMFARAAANVVA